MQTLEKDMKKVSFNLKKDRMPHDEFMDEFNKYKFHGDLKARDKILGQYLYLCANLAQRCQGSEYEDKYQDAWTGLVSAINCFDPTRKTDFGTHAFSHCLNAIQTGRRKNKTVYIPAHVQTCINKLRTVLPQLDHEPTLEELVQLTKKRRSHIELALIAMNKSVISLNNTKVKDQAGSLPSNEALIDDAVEKAELGRIMAERIEKLPDELKKIIKEYYLGDKSLRELGRELGVSHQEVKLRSDEAIKILKGKE